MGFNSVFKGLNCLLLCGDNLPLVYLMNFVFLLKCNTICTNIYDVGGM